MQTVNRRGIIQDIENPEEETTMVWASRKQDLGPGEEVVNSAAVNKSKKETFTISQPKIAI